jgi:hypothetical protein
MLRFIKLRAQKFEYFVGKLFPKTYLNNTKILSNKSGNQTFFLCEIEHLCMGNKLIYKYSNQNNARKKIIKENFNLK